MDSELKDLDGNARVPFLELASLLPDFVYKKLVVEDKRPFKEKSIQVRNTRNTGERLRSLTKQRDAAMGKFHNVINGQGLMVLPS